MSVEDKIKRAEEIYARRQAGTQRRTTTVPINNNNKKDVKLLKKMIIQIAISLIIYLIIYAIHIFSEEFLKKANELLSYDINFEQMYENIKQNIESNIQKIKDKQTNDGAIGGANENEIEENKTEETSTENTENIEDTAAGENKPNEEQTQTLSQEEQDIANIKATTTFIKPVEGTISSQFGQREPTTSTVPKNHTGVDIAANMGTKIVASTGGEVVLASEEGDYGKHLKIQIGEVSIIYAHCNNLYVKQGDTISQGQEIAEVGSTGNSTGPHLHFEIRISERTVDPQKILEL